MKYSDLKIGQTASLRKRFTYEDVMDFCGLSLDNNPIHIDHDYAEKSQFKQNIVHGFLTGSLFSGVIGTILPGNGSVYLSQTMNFRKPVFHNQLITATCTIVDKRIDKPILTLETICKNEEGDVVIDGIAIVKYINKL